MSQLKNLATACAMLTVLANTAAFAEEITVIGWGGAVSEAQKQAYEIPFSEATGIKIISDVYNGGLAQIRAQSEAGNVTWDVVDAELTDATVGCDEGLLQPIDAASLPAGADGKPATEDFFEGALSECGVASNIWSTIYAYDESKFPNGGPQTIADLFDPEAFPGTRALRKSPKTNLEWALMADGVALQDVYDVLATEEGVERAFAVLDRIKDGTIWWEAGAQPPQLLADGEVAITSAYSGRLFNAIVKEDQPFEIVWDGQVWDYAVFIVPNGAPNSDKALDYVRYATSAKALARLVEHIAYPPSRASGVALISDEYQAYLPTSYLDKGIRADVEFWADYGDQLNERFNSWLSAN